MANQDGFDGLSPAVGMVDDQALEDAWNEDPSEALALLSIMSKATDRTLAEKARRLAGKLAIDLTTAQPAPGFGFGPRRLVHASPDSPDLDIDASLEAITSARAEGRSPRIDELKVLERTRPGTALCLLVDSSGSMDGPRLATAALAAAACSWRAPDEFAILAFADRVIEIKALTATRSPEAIVGDVLSLRGHGTTDVALALRAANRQLAAARARRRITILLSDAEVTTGDNPIGSAKKADDLTILAPAEEPEHAEALAKASGARIVLLLGPESLPAALQAATERR